MARDVVVKSPTASAQRVLGLDVLRILAALTILLYHGYWFGVLPVIGANPVTSRISTFGYLAVDIFFVLSGWLLAGQALRMRVSMRDGSFLVFWVRRWLRTLPPYYAGLAGAAVFPVVAGTTLTLSGFAKHVLFLQTIRLPNLYPVSWSLVTEEWFYLLLPLAVAVAAWVGRSRVVAILAAVMLLIPMAVRIDLLGHETWLAVLMTPQARFEGLVIGAGLAALAVHRRERFDLLVRRRGPLLLFGTAGVAVLLAAGNQFNWWFQTVGLLGFSILVGCTIPFLSSLRWPAWAPVGVVVGVTFLSDLTYPIYLVHTVVPRFTWIGARSPILYGAVWLLSVFLAAAALHFAVERPFLAIRSRVAGYRRPGRAPQPAEPAPAHAASAQIV